jgi:cold shock CspA family protein
MFRSGKILKVNDDRGYCFIEIDDDRRGDGGRDGRHVFAHYTVFSPRVQLQSSMAGKAVRFEAAEGQKGLAATIVEFLSEVA